MTADVVHCTYTSPIVYTNQDFDEYQAARTYLGHWYVDGYVQQSKDARLLLVARHPENPNKLNAYLCIERWHFGASPDQRVTF